MLEPTTLDVNFTRKYRSRYAVKKYITLVIDEKSYGCQATSGLMTNNSVNMQRRQKLNIALERGIHSL
jgi:hypothetical protein